jgi:hypothetical protein
MDNYYNYVLDLLYDQKCWSKQYNPEIDYHAEHCAFSRLWKYGDYREAFDYYLAILNKDILPKVENIYSIHYPNAYITVRKFAICVPLKYFTLPKWVKFQTKWKGFSVKNWQDLLKNVYELEYNPILKMKGKIMIVCNDYSDQSVSEEETTDRNDSNDRNDEFYTSSKREFTY